MWEGMGISAARVSPVALDGVKTGETPPAVNTSPVALPTQATGTDGSPAAFQPSRKTLAASGDVTTTYAKFVSRSAVGSSARSGPSACAMQGT